MGECAIKWLFKKNADCLFLELKGVYAVRETLKLMDDDVICYKDVWIICVLTKSHFYQEWHEMIFSYFLSVQESVYWSMNMHSYKFGISGPGNTYYGPYEVNDHLPRAEVSRSAWDYPSTINEEPATTDSQSEGDAVMGVHAIPEECKFKLSCYIF